MNLLIIRHGETPLNVARVLQPPDTPLSLRGQAQASALASRLQAWRDGGALAGIVSRFIRKPPYFVLRYFALRI